MKKTGHPKYLKSVVHCGCGVTFETRSTKGDLHVDICSNCHPFYTGKQRTMDVGGRVDRFNRRFAVAQAAQTPKPA